MSGAIRLRYGLYWLSARLTSRRPVDLDEFKSRRRLYPDAFDVGLSAVLQAELDRIGSDLSVSWPVAPRALWSGASQNERTAQVAALADERAFSIDMSAEGIGYLHGLSTDLSEVARAFDAWFVKPRLEGDEMVKRFPFLAVDSFARVYERGEAIERTWLLLLARAREDLPDIRPFLNMSPLDLSPLIELASAEPRLRQLYPYTSLNLLCFSRWVGWPFSFDLPHAAPSGEGFLVFEPGNGEYPSEEVLGEGDAGRAVELLVSALPEPLEVLYRRPSAS